jgi:hypothetical protein
MGITITRKDVAWNYTGNILSIAVNVIILPVVLRMLSSDELGLWYVFSSISGLALMVDFGFSPTITRNVTYCWCGARELRAEGTPEIDDEGAPNFALLGGLVAASKRIYLILSLVAGLLAFTAGTLYVRQALPEGSIQYLIAWAVYALSIPISLYYSLWFPVLKGIGAVYSGPGCQDTPS